MRNSSISSRDNSRLQFLEAQYGQKRSDCWSKFCQSAGTATFALVGIVAYRALSPIHITVEENPLATLAFNLSIPFVLGSFAGNLVENSLELVGDIARKTHATGVNRIL